MTYTEIIAAALPVSAYFINVIFSRIRSKSQIMSRLGNLDERIEKFNQFGDEGFADISRIAIFAVPYITLIVFTIFLTAPPIFGSILQNMLIFSLTILIAGLSIIPYYLQTKSTSPNLTKEEIKKIFTISKYYKYILFDFYFSLILFVILTNLGPNGISQLINQGVNGLYLLPWNDLFLIMVLLAIQFIYVARLNYPDIKELQQLAFDIETQKGVYVIINAKKEFSGYIDRIGKYLILKNKGLFSSIEWHTIKEIAVERSMGSPRFELGSSTPKAESLPD